MENPTRDLFQQNARDALFKQILVELRQHDAFSRPDAPTLFLVYAHDNPSENAAAHSDCVRHLIDWLKEIRAHILSDRSPQPLWTDRDVGEDAVRNIVANQLCILPSRAGAHSSSIASVDRVIVCGSPLLEQYYHHPFTSQYIDAIQAAYEDGKECDDEIYSIVEQYCRRPGFHHVVTELALLGLRRSKSITPISLGGEDIMTYFSFLRDSELRLKSSVNIASLQRLFFRLLLQVYPNEHVFIDKFRTCFDSACKRVGIENPTSRDAIQNIGCEEIRHALQNYDDYLRASSRHARQQNSSAVGLSTQRESVHLTIPFPRNEDLVPRDMSHVLDRLLPPLDGGTAALWGLGGAGKTQLALDFAYRRSRDSACSVFWVHADTEASFTHDYQVIAQKLGFKGLQGEDMLQAVCDRLSGMPRFVLVLDNADDLELFGVPPQPSTEPSRSLRQYIPCSLRGVILWTSRDKQIAGTLVGASRAIEVSRMTVDEAEQLLETARGEKLAQDERDCAHTLLSGLHWLPLAISQAAAYMRRTDTSVATYLTDLQGRKSRWRLLKKSHHEPHRRSEVTNSVLHTWAISMEHIQRESPMAHKVIRTLAFVNNQSIPFQMVWEAAHYRDKEESEPSTGDDSYKSDSSSSMETADDRVLDAVTRLREFSFLGTQAGPNRTYEMHKLVQESNQYHVERRGNEARAYYSKAALAITDNLFPHSSRETWDECEVYLTHAQETRDWAVWHGERLHVASLLSRVSQFLFDRGRWREKEPADEASYQYRREVLGERHPDTIHSMASFATTYHALGRYGEAEKIKLEVLQLRREVLGERHPDTIKSMAELPATYRAQGQQN